MQKSPIALAREAIHRRRSIGKKIAAGFSVLIAIFSIYVLVRTLSAVNLGDLRQAIAATGNDQIAMAMALTGLSFLTLTGYDALALRQIRARIGYATTALASFTSYAISFVLGFPLITAGTVRYWIYSQVGLSASKVASLTLIAGVTFWFGMIFVLAVGLTLRAEAVSGINHLTPAFNLLIGAGLFAGLLFYLVWVSLRRRKVRIQGFRLQLPGFSLSVGQIVLGVIDQCAAAGVLYVLLPQESHIDFIAFAATYVFAAILGVASNAPGGIGVFEATMLKAVPGVAQEQMLASLLLFRAIYYLGPFILALAMLGAHEAFRRWKSLREAMDRSQRQLDDLE
ncbi:integral membrane protein-like protein [Methylocella silvestris BL2]|uniref:Integral membrane protein-like protein n=1 Tax=Methylocella silvestris (strain DSM 15510 / CIP 108128 / LMG 27833 / NCIMB 13906 / BL2) TaxID=395965 RepID=B8ESC1_METSB|nr:lysylphosphatidylglycerol synthase domain-containing protein [Methylocella silvestris]ACK49811.1 integral membrane protein-like protein [Methylocella silvestris BL2]